MAAIDDLNSEVASFTTSVSNEIAASTTAITAALATSDTAAIEAAVSNLKTVQATLDAYTAKITPVVAAGAAAPTQPAA